MNDVLISILITYIIFSVIASMIGFFYWIKYDTQILGKNPVEIYQDTKLNWFGSLIIYLILFVVFPVLYISFAFIKIFALLYNMVYWLFTTGRK